MHASRKNLVPIGSENSDPGGWLLPSAALSYFGVRANIADTLKEVEDFFDSDLVDNGDSNTTDTWAVAVGSSPTGAARAEANRL